jgi:hypothetical protein
LAPFLAAALSTHRQRIPNAYQHGVAMRWQCVSNGVGLRWERIDLKVVSLSEVRKRRLMLDPAAKEANAQHGRAAANSGRPPRVDMVIHVPSCQQIIDRLGPFFENGSNYGQKGLRESLCEVWEDWESSVNLLV